jgi:16S rRNA (uracil1498-N3)-methyltransferase
MKHRFFVPDAIEIGATVDLTSDERHHARVVRVREGEEVEIFAVTGRNYLGRYESDAIQILRETENREPKTAIHLAMAIIQLDKFELVLQKATELGAQSIIPLITDRMEVRIERIRGKEDRWKKIVLEAVKQSGRSKIPTIEAPAHFDDVIARAGSKIIFDPDANQATERPSSPVTLFIGPEGGFTERELELARINNAGFERLGPRRLRAETAAIVALAVVTARRGDI